MQKPILNRRTASPPARLFHHRLAAAAAHAPTPSLRRKPSSPSRAIFKLRAASRSLLLLGLAPFASAAGSSAPPSPSVASVHIYPSEARLHTRRDTQSFVVQAVYDDGTTRDVTDQAQYEFSQPGTAERDGRQLRPVANGQTSLQAAFAGHSLTLPVTVSNADAERPVGFQLDVMPVFLKAGCNAGSCHGSSRGKDGFQLSLFGYDPDGDYFRLTRENLGRRINLALPHESLVLEKAAGRVTHTGGKLFDDGSPLYQTLLAWLQAGAPKDPADVPRVSALEIHPAESVLAGADARQQLNVRAVYSDGTDRDVTGMAVYLSNNDAAARVTPDGLITSADRGEAFVLARYADVTVGAQVLVIPDEPGFVFPEVPENNYIDGLVHEKLRKMRIVPSGLCDDASFIRRVTLDITGRLPEVEKVKSFVADASPDKRARVIDDLLEGEEFIRMWVMKWAELLQIRTQNNQFEYKNALLYFDWLREQFARNRPLDEMVKDLIAAKGGSFENPAANFYQIERDTLKLAENTAQIFMGMRIQCAQCHNHPFDRWTMDDYYGFAAFFAQVGRKSAEDNRETIVFNRGNGRVRHPVGNRDLPPKFLGGDIPNVEERDRRVVLAEWLASPTNPFFAKNMANIVWAHFLGVGIVDAVDDARISNPPSNPALLEELARRFQQSQFNFKSLVRDICNSRAYQLSVEANDSNQNDERNYAKASVRRVRAEILLDIISQVTETDDKFRGLPQGASATEIADGRTSTFFLTTFGRATRDTACSCEVQMEPNLSQALHLLNGDTVNQKINSGGVVQNLLKAETPPEGVIEELYLRCLARPPSTWETARLTEFLQEDRSQRDVLNDVFWALLNSKEFIFNH